MRPLALIALVLLGGCQSRRLLRLENELLRAENERLLQRNHDLELATPDPEDFSLDPTLDEIAGWLDRAGYVYEWTNDKRVLRLDYAGRNSTFGLSIQRFEKSRVLFLATTDYLRLDEAPGTRGVVLLLVKLAALNYDLLIGKLQLNPETGEIMLSAELNLTSGLGYDTFVETLDRLTRTADERYPELERAAGGEGI